MGIQWGACMRKLGWLRQENVCTCGMHRHQQLNSATCKGLWYDALCDAIIKSAYSYVLRVSRNVTHPLNSAIQSQRIHWSPARLHDDHAEYI